MSYLDVNKFSFSDEALRGFSISDLDDYKTNIIDIKVIFQKNRAIVFNIITDNGKIINYLNKEILKIIKGKYYHYEFIATIDSTSDAGAHFPFCSYNIVVNLINFSKNKIFFINSDKEFNIKIIPTKNMIKHMNRKEQDNLFKFENITFSEYNLKYRYLLELNSFIYNTPILIEKVMIKNENMSNILFQSQNINEQIVNKLSKDNLVRNGHFTCKLDIYLDDFIKFKKSQNTLNLLLETYFIIDIFNGKEDYHLNDVSGFIDLFDGIFYSLGGKKENIIKSCKNENCQQEINFYKEYPLAYKIDFGIDKLEPSLKLYDIDSDKKLSKILSKFRNQIRHPNFKLEKFDLHKLYTFSKGVLRLYIIKHILKISNKDYDIYRILSDFNIYPLVQHKYKYLKKDIIIYNTTLNNYGHHILSESSTYYQTLVSNSMFSKAKPTDFIYDDSFLKEIKKIYIEDNDKIRRGLIFFGIITMDNLILQSSKNSFSLDIKYNELMKNLLSDT